MEKRTVNIPTSYGNIEVVVVGDEHKGGAVELPACFENPHLDEAMDAITSMILAHACAGVDIGSAAYAEGVEAALQCIA